MTDQQAALALDRALDGERGFDLNGSQPLLATAETVQTLFDRQQGTPTEDFLMQLEQQLFPSVENTVLSTPSPAPAMPVRRPSPIGVSRERRFPHTLAAIAAALVLLFGGAGAVIFDGFNLHSTPEPSAIPAIGFGTAEASPSPQGHMWTIDPPDGYTGTSYRPVIANGLIHRVLDVQSGPPLIQSVDIEKQQVLWELPAAITPYQMVATGDLLLLSRGTSATGLSYAVEALDAYTGEERWRIPLVDMPVGLVVADGRVVVLDHKDQINAYDLDTQQKLWSADLSQFVIEPVDGRAPFYSDGRLAETDGAIGAIVSNGRAVALDATNGSVMWANDRTSTGQTTISVVDHRFVVSAEARYAMTVEDDPYSKPATPVAGYDPKTQPCAYVMAPRVGSIPQSVDGYALEIDSFDPASGESPWGVRTHSAVWTFPEDESSLISMIRPGWDAEIGNDDFTIYCRIDGATGAISEIGGSELAGFAISGVDPSDVIGIGGTIEGAPLYVDIDESLARTLPYLDIDVAAIRGFRWVQQSGDTILISAQNGALIGLPKDSPTWTPADPTSGTTSWSVDPPTGTEPLFTGPDSIANDVLLRAFAPDADPTKAQIQAIDLETGAELWKLDAPVELTAMTAAGDLVLIGGPNSETGVVIALDARTGDERWRIAVGEQPVDLDVVNGTLVSLGIDNNIEGYDLNTQFMSWEGYLGLYDDNDHPGMAPLSATGNRLVGMDRSVAAMTANGSVLILDTSNGTWFGVVPGDTEATTTVLPIDDRFVVDRVGAGALNGNAYQADPTPLATAAGLGICRQMIGPSSDPVQSGIAESAQQISSFDPETAALVWSVETHAAIDVYPLDDDDLLAIVPPLLDTPGATYCRIDGDDGSVSEISDLSPVFAFHNPDQPIALGMLVMADGTGLPVELSDDVAASLPYFDASTFGRAKWIQKIDNGYLITTWTGELVFLPSGSSTESVVAIPTGGSANTGWID